MNAPLNSEPTSQAHFSTENRQRPPIKPRTLDVQFDARIPRFWMADNVVATALSNSVNMLFPAGERFFVRSVRHFQSAVGPELREQIQGFFGQEGRHAQAHERMNHYLTEQGYRVEPFLRAYERICYGMLERIVPPELRLASTAAAEHFTAILADNFLRDASLAQKIDPTLRKLLLWHAAEEIEHKAVAFDVLMQVNPSYLLRAMGMAMSSLFLGAWWFTGTLVLLAQERKKVGLQRILDDARWLGKWRRQEQRQGIVKEVFLRGIRGYLRRDFHPNEVDNYDLAMTYLKGAGLA